MWFIVNWLINCLWRTYNQTPVGGTSALVQKKQQQGLLHEQEGHPSTGQPQILKKKNRQHKHCHIFRQISCFSTLAPVFFGTFTRDLLHDVVNYLNVLRSAMFIGMAAFRRP